MNKNLRQVKLKKKFKLVETTTRKDIGLDFGFQYEKLTSLNPRTGP